MVITITSTNYSGQTCDIYFTGCTGNTDTITGVTLPYDYVTDDYEGTYSVYFPTYNNYCPLSIGCITPTPTNTPTITPTPTLTPTPTSSPIPFDADAAAYLADVITSGGTTDATISAATDTLFTSLKSAGLYSKLDVFYPFVGGTASSHAINAKLNKSQDITWYGGLTHDLSGTTGNGTNGYGDLNFQIGTITNNEAAFGLYKTKNVSSYTNSYDMGAIGGSIDTYMLIGTAAGSNNDGNRYYWNSLQFISGAQADARGMWIVSSTGTTGSYEYKNGSLFDSTSSNSVVSNPQDFFIFTYNNNGGAAAKNNGGIGFVFVSSGSLSTAESSTLSNIINTFQTSLGRNTY